MSKIKNAREISGISQQELAEKSGVPVGTIRGWEQGRRIPRDVYQLKKISLVLCCTIDDLIEDYENM